MRKITLTLSAAALCGGFLALAPMSAALAVPAASIGKAATANDVRSTAHYYGYGYYHRHHRHCWWRYGHRHCRW
jgi:hypothetical protein